MHDTSEEFESAVAPLMAEGLLREGTIMGGPCVRAGGEFVAMPHHKGAGVVIKLHRDRVAELIEEGTGLPFAPAGRVFKEWALIETHDEARWQALIRESIAFVTQ